METSTKLILLFVIAVAGPPEGVFADDELAINSYESDRLHPISSNLGYEETPEKRIYTYLSEYKRLPVYNFGIGKRWNEDTDGKRSRQYSFGLGKRTRGPYGFGLGKRFYQYPSDDALESREDALNEFLEGKRGRQPYSFGLGKRDSSNLSPDETIGTGKRPNDPLALRYHFGLGKRTAQQPELQLQPDDTVH